MLYLPRDPISSAVFYCITQIYNAFTDLLVLHGRNDYLCFVLEFRRMDLLRC